MISSKRLTSEVLPTDGLNDTFVRELFALFQRYYDCVDEGRFRRDLREKDAVILLRDRLTGEVRGFSTQQTLRQTVAGRVVRALFSGDTIIDRAYWGEQELVRGWCHFAGQTLAGEPEVPLYWFLISKGYRTYLYLPLFFHRFRPQRDGVSEFFESELLDALAGTKFGSSYHPPTGTLRFRESQGQLKPGLADTPAGREDDPNVRFFLDRNPGYAHGDELVCLAEIAPGNMKSFARRWLLGGMRTPAGSACDTATWSRVAATHDSRESFPATQIRPVLQA